MEVTGNAQVCIESDIGLNREQNEDTYLIVDHNTKDVDIQYHGTMYAVADGMGGYAGGEIASKMACQGLLEYYAENELAAQDPSDFYKIRLRYLKTIIFNTHEKICEYGEQNSEYENMGTTLSVLVLIKNKALIVHVGDSRIYRLRQNSLEQMTQDHTMAQIFMELGHLSSETGSKHPSRHVLTQAVGQEIEVINSRIEKIKKDDIFLLCTDGLNDKLTDIEIKDILLSRSKLKDKCSRLVKKALKMGGKDNVTVIVVQV
ncbi:MAG: protein phosphatase 2C domain-containing protein [Desulfobacterales bacterium]